MSAQDFTVFDEKGHPLKVGSRVTCGTYQAVVTEITDWDGDARDDGTPIAIVPTVVVRFDDDGSEDSFGTSPLWARTDGDLVCGDIDSSDHEYVSGQQSYKDQDVTVCRYCGEDE